MWDGKTNCAFFSFIEMTHHAPPIPCIKTITAYLIILLALLLVTGCATTTIQSLSPLPPAETDEALARFQETLARQAQCAGGVDAKVKVAIKSNWRDGTMEGYLQAMSPSRVKFFGVNPLGQPFLIFASNGESFQLVSVPEGRGYEGRVDGRTFNKYAPPGFQPEAFYYYLIGGLRPGNWQITAIGTTDLDNGYWFDLVQTETGARARIMLDQAKKKFSRQVLLDENGSVLVDLAYDDFPPGACCLPGKIIVTSPTHPLSINLSFNDCRVESSLSSENFEIRIPASFNKVTVP